MREVRARTGIPVWRIDEDGRSFSLIITRAGRDAIGVADETSETQPPVEAGTAKRFNVGTKTEPSSNAGLRPGSKQALLVAMLAKDNGATLTSLVEATGWLPHTTRAAITGLRKRGFAIERTRDEKLGSLYRIVGARRRPSEPEPMAAPAAKRRPARTAVAVDLDDAALAGIAAMAIDGLRGLWRGRRGEEPPKT
jgi:hypothetical protein